MLVLSRETKDGLVLTRVVAIYLQSALTNSCKEASLKYDHCESRLESTLKELEDIKV